MNFAASNEYHDEGRYFQRHLMRQHIGKLEFRPDDIVLDVGCGTGDETRSIATKVCSVTGIDTSKEMLALARANIPGPNLTYSFGDARTCGDNLEWRENFDKVVSFMVLHWFPDHAKALHSILACLKPGGEALLLMVNEGTIAIESDAYLKSHTKWAQYVKGYTISEHPWGRTKSQAKQLLTSCGWTNVKCEIQIGPPSTEDQTKLFFKTVFGQTGRIPEAMQEEYLEDLWQWALSQYTVESPDGQVRLPFESIVIHACKPPRD